MVFSEVVLVCGAGGGVLLAPGGGGVGGGVIAPHPVLSTGRRRPLQRPQPGARGYGRRRPPRPHAQVLQVSRQPHCYQ